MNIKSENRIEILFNNGVTLKEISRTTDIPIKKISQFIKEKQWTRIKSSTYKNKLPVDDRYFIKIDSPNKAYWLGFIFADGYINKNLSKLTIVSKDIEFMEKFKKDIKSGHKITTSKTMDKRSGKYYTSHYLQITSKVFVTNLSKIGVNNDKTENLNFPNIEENLYPFFIAGLFDGDGSISYRKGNKLRISLISTKEILNYIQKYLSKKFNTIPNKLIKVSKNKSNVWRMHLYKDAVLFLKFIYNINYNDLFLKRKYKIYEENCLC